MSLRDPDAFYQALVKLHEGLNPEQCQRLDARLILLMASRIDDERALHELLRIAALTSEKQL